MKAFRHILRAAVLAAVAAAALSCDDGSDSAVSSGATMSVAQTELEPTSGSMFVRITTDAKWRLDLSFPDGEVWATLNTTSFEGSRSVILSWDANPSAEARSLTLTLKAGSNPYLTIIQKGNTVKTDDPSSGGEPSVHSGNSASVKWLELPETKDGDGLDFFAHYFNERKADGRNWSFYWSYDDLVSLWVAYPLNAELIGANVSRTDAWGLDPLLPSGEQPVLLSGFSVGSDMKYYDRGHQLPSADRLGTAARNATTFYGTNMTPQVHAFNGGVWSNLESRVRAWATQSDTLYVVSGCVVEGSSAYAPDNNGKHVTIPTAYYKAVVRYSSSGTLGYSGYMGCALYLDHDPEIPANASLKNYAMSIDALEEKLGYDLFVNLPDVVGSTNAGKIESEDPKNVTWWW